MVKRKTRQKHGLAQVQEQVGAIKDLVLEGNLLAIDPSCISSASVPGWARFEKGELVESGVIAGISPHADLAQRLRFIGEFIREHFEEPDVLILEKINPTGVRKNTSLLKAVGAILGNFECDYVLEILPVVWQKFLYQTHADDYTTAKYYRENTKSDEQDAIEIGQAVIAIAKET